MAGRIKPEFEVEKLKSQIKGWKSLGTALVRKRWNLFFKTTIRQYSKKEKVFFTKHLSESFRGKRPLYVQNRK